MAVQAQYPSNLISNNCSSVLDEFQQFHYRKWDSNHIMTANIQTGLAEQGDQFGGGDAYAAHYYYHGSQMQKQHQQILFSEEPESELTSCINLSGSRRKRTRDDDTNHEMPLINHHLHADMLLQQQQQHYQHHLRGLPPKSCRPSNADHQPQVLTTSITTTAGGLQPPFSYKQDDDENHRLHESRGTSTSGRILPSLVSQSPPPPPLPQDLNYNLLHKENLEIDTLIKLHNEKLRLVIEETRKRQCRSLISYSMKVEHGLVLMKTRLEEKESELANALERNAELEEKLKQMSAENQNWFNMAKNKEATVSTLKSTLAQILAHNYYYKGDENHHHSHGIISTAGPSRLEEGFGDSEEGMMTFPGGAAGIDAQSCCYQEPAGGIGKKEEDNDVIENAITMKKVHHHQQHHQQDIMQGGQEIIKEEIRRKSWCKVCHENQVSVLLLPCRHLCLCNNCESKLDYCPICNSVKNASLQIFIA